MERLTQTRCSTALVELDVAAGTALTASGRPYELCGPCDSAFALTVARSVGGGFFNLDGWSDIRALSPDEAVALMAENKNQPIQMSPEERAAYAERLRILVRDEDDEYERRKP